VREQRLPSAAARFDEHLKRTALVLAERHRSLDSSRQHGP
jgi:hypothetical protein